MNQIIKSPLITEKNSMMAEQGVYAFEVERSATKLEIRRAVEKAFGVKVEKVRTVIARSRARRSQISGKVVESPTQYWKKALVKLKSGEKISLFEGA